MTNKQVETILHRHRLSPAQLRNDCAPADFPFETTAEMEDYQNELIGQQRAVHAMEFGLTVEQNGYNLFVVGPAGTGKTTFTQSRVTAFAKNKQAPNDVCYVYNFENPDKALALSFPAGEGQAFQQRVRKLLLEIKRSIRTSFDSDEYHYKKRIILDGYEKKKDVIWLEMEAFAFENGYIINRTETGITSTPAVNGQPLSQEMFEQLSEKKKAELKKKSKQIESKITQSVNDLHKIDDNLGKSIDLFMKQTASTTVEETFEQLYEDYASYPRVVNYLKSYFQDIVEHFHLFFPEEAPDEQLDLLTIMLGSPSEQLQRYTVNLFINNKDTTGAPVIYEPNPTYQNLFGKIEYRGAFGSMVTDFTHVKPGALHLANGGYLILQAAELLQQPYAWSLLKQMLQINEVSVENPLGENVANPTSGLKPEAIPLQVKIILIGSYYFYDVLSSYDEDFHKLFQVKVEFDSEMNRTDDNKIKLAHYVHKLVLDEGLLPFHRSALAEITNYSSRLVDDQNKLSTEFHRISQVLIEANYWAKKEESTIVQGVHVQKALSEQTYRSNRLAEEYRDMIIDGSIMVETDGERIGQMNGLAIMGTREYVFGIPSKITAQTYVGKSGIMNIEREALLSGQIHHKGLLILTGYLSGTFAKNRMLPLSASITFEQSYQKIEGDSASSTELYVLLSSLAEVPLKQGIAATGSVNQWGEIQIIGGVNDKIEGFYNICQAKGLTNEQGVIIPKQNVANLMLHEEVVQAISEGRFHVWAIETIAQGIEILTGVPAGNVRDEKGKFPEGTIFSKVEARFNDMYEAAMKRQKQLNRSKALPEEAKEI